MALSQNVAAHGPYLTSAAPVAGNEEIQTLAANPAAASITAGTFRLSFGGEVTAAIPFNATTAQLETALNNLLQLGGGGTALVGVAVTGGAFGTTLTVTFAGSRVLQVENTPLLVLHTNSLTGGGSITIARTRTAVAATHRNALPGALLIRDDAGVVNLYQNTAAAGVPPTWATR